MKLSNAQSIEKKLEETKKMIRTLEIEAISFQNVAQKTVLTQQQQTEFDKVLLKIEIWNTILELFFEEKNENEPKKP